MTMNHPIVYAAEHAYRRSTLRRTIAEARLARKVKYRRPKRMDSVHNYR